ncbi:MAG: hypothetical protein HY866_23305 [Chloroflexi bacterium]|nr:hypothetical protein [Chloroflexota bacterium]
MNINQLLADKRVVYALLIGGIVLALLAILIDPLRGNDIYLAPVQIVALIVGVVAAAAGAYLTFVRK